MLVPKLEACWVWIEAIWLGQEKGKPSSSVKGEPWRAGALNSKIC